MGWGVEAHGLGAGDWEELTITMVLLSLHSALLLLCQCPGAAIVTRYHKLGGLNNRNLSHSLGGQKSKIEVLAEWASS